MESTKNKKPVGPQVYVPSWRTNKMLRIYTGLGLIFGLALALLLREVTPYFFDIFLLVVLFACVYDIMKAKQIRKSGIKEYYIYPYLGCAYVVFMVGTLLSPAFGFWMHIIAQVVVLFIWSLYTFFMYYVDKPLEKQCRLKKIPLGRECRRIMRGYWSVIMYPAFMIYTLFALNHIGYLGLFALLLVFVISAFTDTCAYVVGSLLRGPKLLPKKINYISPKKTISGSIGGILGGWLGALILLLIFSAGSEFSDFMTLKIGDATAVMIVFSAIGILGSIATQIGDIYASYIKRKHNIKDFGTYLPGHGGAMDSLDGISFNAVFIFISMLIIVFVA